jgi:YD repeat-containing protein
MPAAPACALLKAKNETWSSKTAYDLDGRVIETRTKLDGTRELVVENKYSRLGRVR